MYSPTQDLQLILQSTQLLLAHTVSEHHSKLGYLSTVSGSDVD